MTRSGALDAATPHPTSGVRVAQGRGLADGRYYTAYRSTTGVESVHAWENARSIYLPEEPEPIEWAPEPDWTKVMRDPEYA